MEHLYNRTTHLLTLEDRIFCKADFCVVVCGSQNGSVLGSDQIVTKLSRVLN